MEPGRSRNHWSPVKPPSATYRPLHGGKDPAEARAQLKLFLVSRDNDTYDNISFNDD